MTDTARALDQFYTHPNIAQQCYAMLNTFLTAQPHYQGHRWLEPSAGNGSFFNLMPTNKEGYDLDPQFPGVVQQDFFTWSPQPHTSYITLGNPPFGKNSSLAVKFFNHAAIASDVIAFIVPKTFKKESVIKRLHPSMHLAFEYDLPSNSFVHCGNPYDVPCVFQIWQKKATQRLAFITPVTADFSFEKDFTKADFLIQRVGVHAGAIKKIDSGVSSQSHWGIKSHVPNVQKVFERLPFHEKKHHTAGNPSLSKGEIIMLYEQHK